jgi:glycosyltransferase involved in cell wall biosynthesis
MQIDYSLIIPCYNEEGNIKSLFDNLLKLKSFRKLEIILVDNGSNDSTYKTLVHHKNKNKRLKIKIIKIKKNKGFGFGVYQGLKKSVGKYLCYTHADRETKILDLKKTFKIIDANSNLDFLIKGRRINRAKNHWTLIDQIFSKSCDFVLSIMLLKQLHDIHAQPNAFPRALFKKINYCPNDFLIDAYFLYAAKKLNYKIIRFNVNFNKKSRKYGQGSSDSLYKKIKGSIDHIIGGFKILIKSNI